MKRATTLGCKDIEIRKSEFVAIAESFFGKRFPLSTQLKNYSVNLKLKG